MRTSEEESGNVFGLEVGETTHMCLLTHTGVPVVANEACQAALQVPDDEQQYSTRGA